MFKSFYIPAPGGYFCRMLLKAMFRAAGVFYFSLLFYIFFLARRRPRPTFNRHIFPHNIVPLKHKFEDAAAYHTMSPIDKWNFITDLVGNIVLFVPLPFFLLLFFGIKNQGRVMLIAFCMSLGVEITQYLLGIGVADVDDIILNILGAGAGILLLKLTSRINFTSALVK